MNHDENHGLQAIFARIGGVPFKVKRGRCAMCDSSISDAWVVRNGKSLVEVRHLSESEDSLLSGPETALLVRAIDTGALPSGSKA